MEQGRLRFAINHNLNEEIAAIEEYYDTPASQLLLDKVLTIVKEKYHSLPADFRESRKQKKTRH